MNSKSSCIILSILQPSTSLFMESCMFDYEDYYEIFNIFSRLFTFQLAWSYWHINMISELMILFPNLFIPNNKWIWVNTVHNLLFLPILFFSSGKTRGITYGIFVAFFENISMWHCLKCIKFASIWLRWILLECLKKCDTWPSGKLKIRLIHGTSPRLETMQ